MAPPSLNQASTGPAIASSLNPEARRMVVHSPDGSIVVQPEQALAGEGAFGLVGSSTRLPPWSQRTLSPTRSRTAPDFLTVIFVCTFPLISQQAPLTSLTRPAYSASCCLCCANAVDDNASAVMNTFKIVRCERLGVMRIPPYSSQQIPRDAISPTSFLRRSPCVPQSCCEWPALR